jgi:guanosine-3',5'-bis(diphosphate) 3'-pyrophosphohydrolase
LQKEIPEGWTQERGEEYFIWGKKVVDNLRGTNEVMENELDKIFRSKNLIK